MTVGNFMHSKMPRDPTAENMVRPATHAPRDQLTSLPGLGRPHFQVGLPWRIVGQEKRNEPDAP
jgi:hypothetical protein